MRKGKVQLKRVEDKHNRQVTFSKRTKGLLKKAEELAVLCDVDVALLIFSGTGKPYPYFSSNSLNRISEHYNVQMDESNAVCRNANEAEMRDGSSKGSGFLHMIQRHLEHGNIDELTITELAQVEQQLDAILNRTGSRKRQIMMKALNDIHDKEQEKMLRDENKLLEREIASILHKDCFYSTDGGDQEKVASITDLLRYMRVQLAIMRRCACRCTDA